MKRTDAWPRPLMAALVLVCLAAAPLAVAEDDGEQPVKEIKMYADNWSWSPKTIRVEQGTRLRILIDNVDATHRFDLKAYKLKVMLPQDKTTTVEFVADTIGEFKWKCGRPCGNGCAKMRGTLIVTEPVPDEEG